MNTRHLSLLVGLLFALTLLSACDRSEFRSTAAATTSANGATSVETLTVDNVARTYRLHLPSGYNPAQATPLVINLHGYGSNATQEEFVSKMSAQADKAGFIVVYPQGLGDPASWKFGGGAGNEADVAFIQNMIAQFQHTYNIDSKRIYVTGISNGAIMSYRLVCDLPNTFAAFATVAGGYPPFRDCQSGPRPVIMFHGTADGILPYEGKPPALQPVHDWAANWAAHNGCATQPSIIFQQAEVTGEQWNQCRDNADVILYTIAGKGHSWPGSPIPTSLSTRTVDATELIWQFFAAHAKS